MAARRTRWIPWALLIAALGAPAAPRAARLGGDARTVAEAIAAAARTGDLEANVGPDELVLSAGGAALVRAQVRDEGRPEDEAGSAHVHVVARLPGAPAPGLDACVFGQGGTRQEALRAAARAYVERALPPILAMAREEASTTALRFGGDEPYAVPGFRGLAGPLVFWAKGLSQAELEELFTAGRMFGGLSPAELPADGRPHLLKVVLLARDGTWSRTLELDGRATSITGERWAGVPAPPAPVMALRFAVFRDRDTLQRSAAWRSARARLAAREPWLFGGEPCPRRLAPARLFSPPFAEQACAGGRLEACLEECKAGSGPSCYGAASEVERQDAPDEESHALYLRACRLGVASGCTNAAALLAKDEQRGRALPAGVDRACAWETFDVVCERAQDPWACTMLGTGLVEGKQLRRDPARARAVLARSCRFGPSDPACQTARRLLQQLDEGQGSEHPAPGAR